MYECRVLADSLAATNGYRLTTMEVTFPRLVLAEFNTHRMFSRNSASSRAIPVEKMIQRVLHDPFIPIYWGKNQKGMQAEIELSPEEQERAEEKWLAARDNAIVSAQQLLGLGIHKQITNRLLEPFMWHTVIVTATEWQNFFALRTHKDAQPEIQRIAEMMKEAYETSHPTLKYFGDYHLPLLEDEDYLRERGFTEEQLIDICVGRCARVSYLTHEGKKDPLADIALAKRLAHSGHMSPFEHAATPSFVAGQSGNFTGWYQCRKSLPNEAIYAPDSHPLG